MLKGIDYVQPVAQEIRTTLTNNNNHTETRSDGGCRLICCPFDCRMGDGCPVEGHRWNRSFLHRVHAWRSSSDRPASTYCFPTVPLLSSACWCFHFLLLHYSHCCFVGLHNLRRCFFSFFAESPLGTSSWNGVSAPPL